jgi:hypothetical protein
MNHNLQEKSARTIALILAIALAVVGAVAVNQLVLFVDGTPPHTKHRKKPTNVRYVLPEVSLSDSTVPKHFVF